MNYILAHDLGTSGNKATLYDETGAMVASDVASYPLDTDGCYAQQNAHHWWQAVCQTTKQLLEHVNPAQVAAVSFSGQMNGCLCVDSAGNPLGPSLIWADNRSTPQEWQLREKISESRFYQITGQRLSASFSITKLMWVKQNQPEMYAKTHKMLNAKDYMLHRLTGAFVTEPSDASSTCMMDLSTRTWSQELLALADLDAEKLPEILPSTAVAGTVTQEASVATGLLAGTPVVCGGGDGCCAAVGTGVICEGKANCSLGTSSWISIASPLPVMDDNMTASNFAHVVPGYVLPCGSMQTGGGALSFAAKTLFGGVEGKEAFSNREIYATIAKEVAESPVGANGLLFLPHLMGERSPRWNDKAKGAFIGLTLGHTRGDMLRAVMEGVGYNLDIILRIFQAAGAPISSLTLVGGGARNRCWQTILSDIFGVPLRIPTHLEEAASMGAAVTAGVGVGLFDDFSAVERFLSYSHSVTPHEGHHQSYAVAKQRFDMAYRANEPIFNIL